MPTAPRSLALLYWSLVATVLLTALVVIATFWADTRNRDEEQWVRHTLEVRNQISTVHGLSLRAESGQRGFLLTGREAYLVPYDEAKTRLPTELDRLASLVADNPPQLQLIARMQMLLKDKLDELQSTIADRKAGRADAALRTVNTDIGQRFTDEFRTLVSTMDAEENRLLAQRQANASILASSLRVGVVVSFALICIAAAIGGFLTRRSFNELSRAYDLLIAANQKLLEEASARVNAEAQLRQSQKMEAIGQLSGGIAHDFNNMLGVIGGGLDLMQRRIQRGDYAVERYVDAAVQATKRAASLTQRLLAFARQSPLQTEALDANRMIAGMSELLRSTLGEHIQIETVMAGGLWVTKADPHQLENVILNIAINARDAMLDGGRLTIETANAYLDESYVRQHADVTPGQFVMIAITDTGSGMPPEVLARAFDPFYTTKKIGSGTGLGLSQVYGFIKQSQGHIKIYSEVGTGTTVKVYLPRHHGDAATLQRNVPTLVKGAGEVILLVEDDALMRRMTTESLRELDYTVVECEGASAALALLDTRQDVALLLTDVVMPEMNGRKLADAALQRQPRLKVLFTTGYTPNAVVHGGVLDPGVELLTKPFTLEQLATKVRAVLSKS